MKDLKHELKSLRLELDITQQEFCSLDEEKTFRKLKKQKQPLPDDIYVDSSGTPFRLIETDMSEDEISKLLLYRRTSYLRSIKNCAILCAISAVLIMILAILGLLR